MATANVRGPSVEEGPPTPLTTTQEMRVRMIRQLRWSSSWNYSPRWSFEQIAEAFGMTVEEMQAEIDAFPKPFQWREEGLPLVVNRLFDFWKIHKRWPTHKDWLAVNGLPSRGTLNAIQNHGARWPREMGWGRGGTTWKDGWVAAQEAIARDRRATPAQILALPNVTVRRTAMERFGVERLIKKGNGKRIASDKYGTLWELPAHGEMIVFLEVVNSTPEPDGTFAHYFLRVPPSMRIPQQAAAWTFGIDGDEWVDFRIEVAT